MYFRSNINHHSKKYGDVEYDITLASYGPGTGTQTRIETRIKTLRDLTHHTITWNIITDIQL